MMTLLDVHHTSKVLYLFQLEMIPISVVVAHLCVRPVTGFWHTWTDT